MNIVLEKSKLVFAENLVYYLDKKDKKQVELAEHLGVTKGAVSQWCSGKSTPSSATAKQIADFLNVELSDLTTERRELTPTELKFALFGGDISDNALDEVMKYAEYVKNRENIKD